MFISFSAFTTFLHSYPFPPSAILYHVHHSTVTSRLRSRRPQRTSRHPINSWSHPGCHTGLQPRLLADRAPECRGLGRRMYSGRPGESIFSHFGEKISRSRAVITSYLLPGNSWRRNSTDKDTTKIFLFGMCLVNLVAVNHGYGRPSSTLSPENIRMALQVSKPRLPFSPQKHSAAYHLPSPFRHRCST